MVLAAAVRAESSFPFFRVLFFRGFCHFDHPSLWKIRQHYLKESSAAQVPGKIVMRASLQQKNDKTEMENIAEVEAWNSPPEMSPTSHFAGNRVSPNI